MVKQQTCNGCRHDDVKNWGAPCGHPDAGKREFWAKPTEECYEPKESENAERAASEKG